MVVPRSWVGYITPLEAQSPLCLDCVSSSTRSVINEACSTAGAALALSHAQFTTDAGDLEVDWLVQNARFNSSLLGQANPIIEIFCEQGYIDGQNCFLCVFRSMGISKHCPSAHQSQDTIT